MGLRPFPLLCCLWSFAVVLLSPVAILAADEGEGGFLGINEAELRLRNDKGSFDLLVSGILDLEFYGVQDEAPGLLFTDHSFLTERLRLFVDTTVGDHWFFFLQARADRGFDADDHPVAVRGDEYFARYTLSGDDWSWSFQLGKFATPLGNFVARHDSMKNPLVRAPLFYDHVTVLGDDQAPANNAALLGRRDIEDKKEEWVPMIWGPVYHAGGMVVGTAGPVELRFAVTNSAPCERPDEWEWGDKDEEHLAYSARFGWRAFPGFTVGANYAVGPYFRGKAERTFGRGQDRNDFDQHLAGLDLEYLIGHWEFWAEVFGSQWDAPNIRGDLRALGYYVEGKYTLTPRLHVSGRWAQMFF
ncbi:MAG: hypothetical protein HYZ53_05530, partial [Planctomycetes bacterium]|nr:hypothetical protein [Planctomycetota bacterium]